LEFSLRFTTSLGLLPPGIPLFLQLADTLAKKLQFNGNTGDCLREYARSPV